MKVQGVHQILCAKILKYIFDSVPISVHFASGLLNGRSITDRSCRFQKNNTLCQNWRSSKVEIFITNSRTPALQQNWQSSEKSQHFKEKTIFNEHPVYTDKDRRTKISLEVSLKSLNISKKSWFKLIFKTRNPQPQ